ncbi:hypothetical protein BJ912DRAFT_930675 [Pholiota molesta]|nr:hypothetical protein BJ912DRAFT_930675 [Pholiota molesta]
MCGVTCILSINHHDHAAGQQPRGPQRRMAAIDKRDDDWGSVEAPLKSTTTDRRWPHGRRAAGEERMAAADDDRSMARNEWRRRTMTDRWRSTHGRRAAGEERMAAADDDRLMAADRRRARGRRAAGEERLWTTADASGARTMVEKAGERRTAGARARPTRGEPISTRHRLDSPPPLSIDEDGSSAARVRAGPAVTKFHTRNWLAGGAVGGVCAAAPPGTPLCGLGQRRHDASFAGAAVRQPCPHHVPAPDKSNGARRRAAGLTTNATIASTTANGAPTNATANTNVTTSSAAGNANAVAAETSTAKAIRARMQWRSRIRHTRRGARPGAGQQDYYT